MNVSGTQYLDSGPGLILVVDSDTSSRAAVAQALTPQGHTVLESAVPAEALALLETNPQVELLVCDRGSADPRAAGLLSEGTTWPDPGRRPIVVLCTPDNREEAARCLASGAVDLASYPVFGPELAARVRNLLALHRAELRLATMAFQDPLTGLYNHRVFAEMLGRAVARALRRKSPLGVIMADLDHFKRINEAHGHPVGDQVLKEFARRAAGQIRLGDVLARYGGEEFAIIAADADLAASVAVAERVRAVLRKPVPTTKGDIQLSASLGVAVLENGLQPSAGRLAEKALAALQQAKNQGRDRVVCSA